MMQEEEEVLVGKDGLFCRCKAEEKAQMLDEMRRDENLEKMQVFFRKRNEKVIPKRLERKRALHRQAQGSDFRQRISSHANRFNAGKSHANGKLDTHFRKNSPLQVFF